MPNQLTVSGFVLEKNTNIAQEGIIVILTTPNGPLTAKSGIDGKYEFPLMTVPELSDSQKTYTIKLQVEDNSTWTQDPEIVTIQVQPGVQTIQQDLQIINRGLINNTVGKVFLAVLIALLVGVGVLYCWTHKLSPEEEAINPRIVHTLTESLVDRIDIDSIRVFSFNLTDTSQTLTKADSLFIVAESGQIRNGAHELITAAYSDASIKSLIDRSLEDLDEAISNHDKSGILSALSSAKYQIKEVPNLLPSWLWTGTPGRYYEIIFWALFATILRLIGNTSLYVSRNCFYRDSIYNKIPLIFTIPIIALLIAFVISYFRIAIALGNSNVTLDFTDPFISIILAALIGLAPWNAWKFMYGLAEKLFKALNSWLSSEEDEAQNNTEESNPTA